MTSWILMISQFKNLYYLFCKYFFFFFQAEDGIRDDLVTGVQTCALPILRTGDSRPADLQLPQRLRREAAEPAPGDRARRDAGLDTRHGSPVLRQAEARGELRGGEVAVGGPVEAALQPGGHPVV